MALHELTGQFFVTSSTSATYPAAANGSTTTAGSSVFADTGDERKGILLSVAVIGGTTSVAQCTIEDHDGNTLLEIDSGVSSASASFLPLNFPIGPAGVRFDNGLRATSSNALVAFILVYQKKAG